MRKTAVIAVALGALGTACCRHGAASPTDAAKRPQEGAQAQAERWPGAREAVAGEYVVTTAPGTTASSLQSSLADLVPRKIQALGEGKFLVTFGDDPGLSRLSFRVGNGQILAVQPNYVYKAPPPR